MNAVVKTDGHAAIDLADWRSNQAEAIQTLRDSLYPGAKDESIIMALRYCEAAKLDPLQKPVHLVPMSVKSGRKDEDGYETYETRDVVMPGIGLYRTQAARTGQYAGLSEPEFGPTCTLKYQRKESEWYTKENGKRAKRERWVDAELEYPLWCKVVCKRLVQGVVCEFPAVEYWTENYATAGKTTAAPNSMWERRPRGQIGKCCEAQALRKAFPEAVGSQPTAEEMEGRGVIELDDVQQIASAPPPQSLMPQSVKEAPVADPAAPIGAPAAQQTQAPAAETAPATAAAATPQAQQAQQAPAADPKPAGKTASEGMIRVLRKKAAANKVDEAVICQKFGVTKLDDLTVDTVNKAMAFAGNPA